MIMKTYLFFRTYRAITTKYGLFVCLCTVPLFQTGCASTGSTSAGWKGPSPNQYHTFAVSVLSPEGTAIDRATVTALAPTAIEAASSTMKSKGYQEPPLGEADLVVRLQGKFAADFATERSFQTGTLQPSIERESAQTRVLLVSVQDQRTQKILWSDSRARSAVGTPTADRLRTIIAEMLAPVPDARP
jgi:hypothetical protein